MSYLVIHLVNKYLQSAPKLNLSDTATILPLEIIDSLPITLTDTTWSSIPWSQVTATTGFVFELLPLWFTSIHTYQTGSNSFNIGSVENVVQTTVLAYFHSYHSDIHWNNCYTKKCPLQLWWVIHRYFLPSLTRQGPTPFALIENTSTLLLPLGSHLVPQQLQVV